MRVLIPQGLYSKTGSKSSRTKGWSSVQDVLKPQLPGRREGSEHASLVGELPSPEPSGDLNCKLRLPIPARSWQTEAAPPSKSSIEQQPPAWKHLDFWRFVNVQCEYVILVMVPKSKRAILSCFTWASHAPSWQVTFYYTLNVSAFSRWSVTCTCEVRCGSRHWWHHVRAQRTLTNTEPNEYSFTKVTEHLKALTSLW